MKEEYKVRFLGGVSYEVIMITTTYIERTSTNESESNKVEENSVYIGEIANCLAYINLAEGGYLYPTNLI